MAYETMARGYPPLHGASGNAPPMRGQELRQTDRVMSAAGGGALALWGIRRGGLVGLASLALGGALLARSVAGRSFGGYSLTDLERNVMSRHGWSSAVAVERSITIRRPREEVYRFWRDFSNFGRFMRHVARVEILDSNRSRWTVHAPFGQTVSWVARVVEDAPGQRIAWASEPGADIANSGWVEFNEALGGSGTEVRVMIAYEPPAGQVGRWLAKLWGEEPGVQLSDDLQRLKHLLENTGTVANEEKLAAHPTNPSTIGG